MSHVEFTVNQDLDLVLEKTIEAPVEVVWKAWTRPEYLQKWFVPRPWTISSCELNVFPGGIFKTVMCSPEGQEMPNTGCYLEVVENERLVWTSALLPGFRPVTAAENGADMLFSVAILFESKGNQTIQKTIAIHRSEEEAKRHSDMGFHDGWGACYDQMIELIQNNEIQ